MGAGALTSSLIVATLGRPYIRMLIGGGILLGSAELVLAGTTLFPVAVAATFVCGMGAVATSASANSIVQISVPGPLRGRVMSVYTTVFAGSTPIGAGMTGTIGGLFGTPLALATGGTIAVLAELGAAAAVLRGHVPSVRTRNVAPVPGAEALPGDATRSAPSAD